VTSPWLQWAGRQASSLFQGIDYLELTLHPDEQSPTSATLVVHLQETWVAPQFSERSFAISGGLRITDIGFTYDGENSAQKTVTLKLSTIGDASEYTLTLLPSGGGPLGLQVHPFFGSATFVFTLSCERGDCRPLAEQPPKALRPRAAAAPRTND
jgi:hypothetical protein